VSSLAIFKDSFINISLVLQKAMLIIMANQLSFIFFLQCLLITFSFVVLGFFFSFFFAKNFIFIGEFLKQRFTYSLIAGFFSILLAILLAFAVVGTMIGILFLPALIFIYLFCAFFSFYTLALTVGEYLVKLISFRDQPYLEIFCGTLLLLISLCVPFIGPSLVMILFTASLGSVLLTKFGRI